MIAGKTPIPEPSGKKDEALVWQKRSDPLYAVFNPAAGNRDSDQVERLLRTVLDEQSFPYRFHKTKAQEDLPAQVRAARQDGFQRFLVAGGDGTVSAAASGLVETGLPLAIVPTGTANALARIFAIPLDLDQAARWWLAAHQTKVIDAMRVSDHHYFLNLSLGVSSQALRDINAKDKDRLGWLVYIWKGLQQLAGVSPFMYRMVVDGKSFTRRASELVVANMGIQQFRPLRLDPEIRMDDGVLTVCHLRARHLGDYLRIAANAVLGRTDQAYGVTCRTAEQSVQIESQPRLPVQADGELIGETPVALQVVPEATHFLIPNGS